MRSEIEGLREIAHLLDPESIMRDQAQTRQLRASQIQQLELCLKFSHIEGDGELTRKYQTEMFMLQTKSLAEEVAGAELVERIRRGARFKK